MVFTLIIIPLTLKQAKIALFIVLIHNYISGKLLILNNLVKIMILRILDILINLYNAFKSFIRALSGKIVGTIRTKSFVVNNFVLSNLYK